jgi:4-diphosphocytidyl-2-C-methyl-D-erythritol kinase
VRCFSPAKLNLSFRVLGKRLDGYHEIASVYQAIDFGDILEFAVLQQEPDRLTCTDPQLPCDSSNLVLKATALFRNKTGLSFGVSIHLEKQIFIEAGLGGGSSNAATTLWALNQLLQTKIPDNELAIWAAELGSDIPFFFSRGSAYCTGRGEIVEEIPLLPFQGYLAKPPYRLSTLQVYRNVRVPSCESLNMRPFFNDLESSAFALCPELSILKKQLLDLGFDEVCMTGSGTAFFCLGEMEDPQLPSVHFRKIKACWREGDNWYA